MRNYNIESGIFFITIINLIFYIICPLLGLFVTILIYMAYKLNISQVSYNPIKSLSTYYKFPLKRRDKEIYDSNNNLCLDFEGDVKILDEIIRSINRQSSYKKFNQVYLFRGDGVHIYIDHINCLRVRGFNRLRSVHNLSYKDAEKVQELLGNYIIKLIS